MQHFLLFLALDVTASCICEIHSLAVDGFNINGVHKLSSKEVLGFNPGLPGGKQEFFCLLLRSPQKCKT